MVNRVLCKCQECLLRNSSGLRVVSSAFLDHQRIERFKAAIAALEREHATVDNEAIDQLLDEDQERQMRELAQGDYMESDRVISQDPIDGRNNGSAVEGEDDMYFGQDLPDNLLDEEDESDDDVDEEEEEDEEENGDSHAHEGGPNMHRDPFVPSHPAAFILFILVVLFYGRYLSDHALEIMMQAFNLLLKIMGIPYAFPSRVEPLKRWIKRQSDVHGGVKEHVMCSKCSSIYPYQTQEERERMHRHTHCVFKDTLRNSSKCMTPLFQDLQLNTDSPPSTAARSTTHVPAKRFYSNSVVHTLKLFMRRKGFASMLEATYERNVSGFGRAEGYTCDVQHGSVYQTFKLSNEDSVPFTKEDPFNLLLLLNMDHFQPHQYSSYSVGGVWLSILNLSHEERLLRKNTILSSILPGPKEATQMEMVRLLQPLIEELKTLQHGVVMEDSDGRKITVKACLVLVSSDLPAIRKLLGVAAHNGLCSCAFCDVQFTSLDNNQRDYSNMDIDTYPQRTRETHASNSADWLTARTQTERDEKKKATGTSYSAFQELPYFDCIKFQSVDVLHCSYLGIAKRIIRTIWLDINCTVESNTRLLSTTDLKEMSKLLSKDFVFPFNLDGQSIHRKLLVGDGAAYLKGDEIRVFLLVSPYLLQGRLPHAKYENFMMFVEINRLLTSPGLYTQDIQKIKLLSKQFMQDFLRLYGDAKYVAFNFHLFLHLPQAIERYSTPCNYWLYHFERLNGEIKSLNTSNNSNGNIEKTFLDRFLSGVYSDDLFAALPKPASMSAHDIISETLDAMCLSTDGKKTGLASDRMKAEHDISKATFDLAEYLEKEQQSSTFSADDGSFDDEDNMFVGFEILPTSATSTIKINHAKPATVMLFAQYIYLVQYYNTTYSRSREMWADLYVGGVRGTSSAFEGTVFSVSNLIRKFKQVKLFGYSYKSLEGTSSKLKRGSYVLAYCRNDPTPASPTVCLRPGQIIYFFRHSTTVRDVHTGSLFENQVHTFAFVRFFKRDHRNFTAFNRYHMSVCKNEFEEDSVMCIVPLLRIHSPIAIKINHFENVNIIIDLPRSAF